jgi:chemotaxis protein methyltransferase CheR
MITAEQLHRIKAEIALVLGWDFKSTRSLDLERGLRSMAAELGVSPHHPSEFTSWLENITWDHRYIDILAKYLTVGETYFFREKAHLDFFRKHILSEKMLNQGPGGPSFNIWSAGCCTGEEPYTLAMIIKETLGDKHHLPIRIFGSDVNKEFLHKATRGIYTSWSFRETPPEIREKYFTKHGNRYEIVPEIKKMITFGFMNLANGNFSGFPEDVVPFHLIFCRNVLMYFTPDQIRKATSGFYSCLTDQGYLIPGIVEVNDDNFYKFNPLQLKTCTIYQKGSIPGKPFAEPVKPDNNKRILSALPENKVKTTRKPEDKAHNKPKPPPLIPHVISLDTQAGSIEPKDLFQSGEYERCIRECMVRLEGDKNNTELLKLILKSYANTGQLSEALRYGEHLISLATASSDDFYHVAQVMFETGNFDQALQILKKALYLDPNHIFSQYLMGLVLQRLGKNEASQKHFRNALDVLNQHQDNEVLPGAEGLTAGRIRQMITNMKNNG